MSSNLCQPGMNDSLQVTPLWFHSKNTYHTTSHTYKQIWNNKKNSSDFLLIIWYISNLFGRLLTVIFHILWIWTPPFGYHFLWIHKRIHERILKDWGNVISRTMTAISGYDIYITLLGVIYLKIYFHCILLPHKLIWKSHFFHFILLCKTYEICPTSTFRII